ncbi:MAG TPA: hypothetical protein VFQ58_08155 [Flavisolibacter sp.]|jgi:hypothetical protein|nr:hypothetical protein [Flavisolibacter sp.]
MKLTYPYRFLVAFFFTCILHSYAFSQNITGIWRGYFITAYGEQYKYELQIKQVPSGALNGVSYSYLDTRFYGKAILAGNFVTTGKSALIQETKTVEVKISDGSTTCIMKCFFTYAVSGKEEFLEGTFSSSYEKTDSSIGIRKGGNCGGGKVFLRKVPTSDFYVEPFLEDKISSNPNTVHPKTITPAKPALPKKLVTKKKIVTKPLAHKKFPANQTTSKTNETTRIKRDTISIRTNTTGPVTIETHEEPKLSAPVITRSRQNELVQSITVTSDEIKVRLYDNGEVDGDTVSVYMDGKPLAMNKMLSTVPIVLSIKMDESNPDHTLVMYAENMGRIPPNTSLMIVQDGDKRYEVSIVSTEQKNAMVRFHYARPKQ